MGTQLRARQFEPAARAARAVEGCLVHGPDALVINGGVRSGSRALERAHERRKGVPREHAGGGLRGGEGRAEPLLVRRVLALPRLGHMRVQAGRHAATAKGLRTVAAKGLRTVAAKGLRTVAAGERARSQPGHKGLRAEWAAACLDEQR